MTEHNRPDGAAGRGRRRPDPILVLAAACLGGRRLIEEGLGRLGSSVLQLEEAGAGVLRVGTEGVSFPDLWTRVSIYRDCASADRRAAHEILARLRHGAGDREAAAWHLHLAGAPRDEAAAALVERAALARRDGGDLGRAADVLEALAAQADSEEAAQAITVRAARFHMAAGRPGPAARLARSALSGSVVPATRGAALVVLARAAVSAGADGEARRTMVRDAEELAPGDPALASLVLAHAAGAELRAGCPAEAVSAARRSVEIAPSGDAYSRLIGTMTLGAALMAGGRRAEALALAPRPAEVTGGVDILSEGALAAVTAGGASILAEDYATAAEILDGLEGRARTVGAVDSLPAILATRALLDHRRCRWPAAAAAAAEALDVARHCGNQAAARWASSVLATVEAVQGRTAVCRQRCLHLLDPVSGSSPMTRTAALSALGLLELGDGHFDAAIHWYQVLAGAFAPHSRLSPAVNMWEADMAEAYVGAGRLREADQVLRQLEERAERSANFRSRAAVMRVRAMLTPDETEAETLFGRVLEVYAEPEWRFARARTTLAWGARLAARGRPEAAVENLDQAREAFDRMGALGWATRAAAELERVRSASRSGPATGAGLTPPEIQAAMAAALGSDVVDIAGGLFVGRAAAQAHLTTAMEKLGVNSPSELAPLLPGLAREAAESLPRPAPAPNDNATAPAVAVSIRLLGGFAVAAGGQEAELHDGITAQAVKAVALAAKLPAEELIELLWPESDPDLGRSRLRSLLARLRRSFRPVLVRNGSWIVLAPDVEVDVDVFERQAGEALAAVSSGDGRAPALARRALDRYGGELLPTDRHLDFTVGPRERVRRRYLSLTGVVVDDACARGDHETAVRQLEDAISTDPYDGELYVRAAAILVGAGRRIEARSVIRRAERAFAELGLPMPPAAEELRRSL